MNAVPGHPDIVLDERGVAWVRDTVLKVRELVVEHNAYGWDEAELKEQHEHLTLPQIRAALRYYSCFPAVVDREIAAANEAVAAFRAEFGDSDLVERLKRRAARQA
jgi:uncharacterized protein (DUF433 family)